MSAEFPWCGELFCKRFNYIHNSELVTVPKGRYLSKIEVWTSADSYNGAGEDAFAKIWKWENGASHLVCATDMLKNDYIVFQKGFTDTFSSEVFGSCRDTDFNGMEILAISLELSAADKSVQWTVDKFSIHFGNTELIECNERQGLHSDGGTLQF